MELYLHSPIRLHVVVLRKSTGTTLPLPLQQLQLRISCCNYAFC